VLANLVVFQSLSVSKFVLLCSKVILRTEEGVYFPRKARIRVGRQVREGHGLWLGRGRGQSSETYKGRNRGAICAQAATVMRKAHV
jgi:hypothetical protein